MQTRFQAIIASVQVKPPKKEDGIPVGEPITRLVLDIEGTAECGDLARFVGQVVEVDVDSLQLALPEFEPVGSREG